VPRAAADPPPPSEPQARDESGSASFLARHRRSLLIATASGAAAAGLTAMLFRREANARYDEYQETAHPDEIADLYAETARLDEVAAGFFITAEALFVATIYLGFFVDPAEERAAVSDASPLRPRTGDARLWPTLSVHQSDTRVALEWRF